MQAPTPMNPGTFGALVAHLDPFSPHTIRRGSEHQESLLTKALQSQSMRIPTSRKLFAAYRRLYHQQYQLCFDLRHWDHHSRPHKLSESAVAQCWVCASCRPTAGVAQRNKEPAVQALEKKRCISFACAARPKPDEKVSIPPPPRPTRDEGKAEGTPKKTSIKFACPPQPSRATGVQQVETRPRPSTPKPSSNLDKPRSPSTVRAYRSPTSRRAPGSPSAVRNKKWLTAESGDLQSECVRFHEFASDEPQEDDWIRRDSSTLKPKLTIDDTLKKENAIRKIGREAEEELEEEIDEEEDDEEVDEADLIDDNGDDDDDETQDGDDGDDSDEADNDEDDDDEGMDDDVETEHAWGSEASDGYKTDNEIGFAESDDEDDGLILWTARIGQYQSLSGATSMTRRLSQGDNSDSSTSSEQTRARSSKKRRSKTRPVTFRSATPELPDSTDFVCGTLDEDRPLEEAYISCVEARRRNRHQPIPQDIDPSFPTSEPEDEADELHRKGYGDSEEHVWLHGELEDLHHERDRRGRKKKAAALSPKRCRSPPPKRRPSPAPKARGRSPRKLPNQRSPRLRSPAPPHTAYKSPIVSPEGDGVAFKTLAFQPVLSQAKSLPRAPGMFPHLKARKPRAGNATKGTHVRGAIDIVKGLEQKRQRRKEKFYQKYYNRARKEKAQTKRAPPGQGAERMRELGLIMAGKAGHGHYVLSV
ncbi:hypothetical protein NEMBOFW57_000566 [Staphylotrichum longicolle]|uniref:Uncharacterized protein n=1 Tax=Staphylotrichum longicolle TaxID=669026 RepID=A0AAD4EZK1_9PEZI|nr:hypothetical protein NEMBOFW57_000566 [Staphylotrichum longicolle]